MGDVHMVVRIRAAHVERGVGAGGGVHPERVQEGLHLPEVGSLEAGERDVVGVDHGSGHPEIVRRRNFDVKRFCIEVS